MPLPALVPVAARYIAWLRDTALPLWAGAGWDPVGGGFREAIDPTGRPIAAPVRVRVQARQTWVFAQGDRIGWEGPWRARLDSGLASLLTRYRRPDGAFRAAVAPDGRVVADDFTLYDQAFVLLAMAGASAASEPPEGLAGAARDLLGEIIIPLRHTGGGFRETGGQIFQSNANMHLFEATQAWSALDPAGPWDGVADEIAALALGRFIEGGRLREFFDSDWRPASGEAGRRIEPGHQFEWAWLLERWGVARGEAAARAAASRLFRTGEAGVDRKRHVAVDALTFDLTVLEPTARLWPQTERLRAAAALARRSDEDQPRYLAAAHDAAEGLWRYLESAYPGAWRDRMDAGGAFRADEPAPGSSLYHLVGAILELA